MSLDVAHLEKMVISDVFHLLIIILSDLCIAQG
jgi:hypothetical protein